MFLRLALLPRFLCSFHDLNAEDARVYARLVNLRVDTPLIVKVLLNDSGMALSIVWAVSVSVFAYFLFIFERGDSEQESVYSLAKYRNCLWLIIITMTTVGYGDIFPQTRMGRITTVIACFFAVVAFALTVNWSLKVAQSPQALDSLPSATDPRPSTLDPQPSTLSPKARTPNPRSFLSRATRSLFIGL